MEFIALSWKNYDVNLSSGFHELLKNEYLVDVTLAVEGQFIKAHKTILSICSPYFHQLFKDNPCKHPVVIMHGINYSTLSNIVEFIYKGNVTIREADIPEFLIVADSLQVKGLMERVDGNAQSSNGVNSSKFPSDIAERQTQVIKCGKPLKPRPYSKPEPPPIAVPIAQPPAAVEIIPLPIEPSTTTTTTTNIPATETPEEPAHLNDQIYCSTSIDTQLGEPSNSKKHDDDFYKSQQASTSSGGPRTVQCLMDKDGSLRLLIDGHTFLKKSKDKTKTYWACRNARRRSCPASCQTQNGAIKRWPQEHNHPVEHGAFHYLEEYTVVPMEQML